MVQALPSTFEEAIRQGGREVSQEEFDRYIGSLDHSLIARNLIDCTQPENDGRECFHTSQCFQGVRAFRYCQNGLCQRTVFVPCAE